MAFEDFKEPLRISYLDLYVYSGIQAHATDSCMQKCSSYSKDVLFALGQLDYKIILQNLKEMGMDITKPVEEEFVWHKPICMAVASRKEDKPMIFGLTYSGYLRSDDEWKEEQLKAKGVI